MRRSSSRRTVAFRTLQMLGDDDDDDDDEDHWEQLDRR